MKPKTPSDDKDELRPKYGFDFSTAERGRYAARLETEGSNLVLVEPDLAKAFPGSASVNAALRSVVEFAQARRFDASASSSTQNIGRRGR